MKLTFVGTSHGFPQKDRFSTCILLECGSASYLIDAGAPIADYLIRTDKSPLNLRAVFTTHSHSDHTYGILHLAALMNWCRCYRDCSTDFFFTKATQADATVQWLRSCSDKSLDEKRLRFRVAEAGTVYQDDNIKVEYIPTAHIDPSYAILVTAGKKRILFGGDFSYGLQKKDVPDVIREPIDAFVCELAHFTLEELTPYLCTCRAKHVFFIHAKSDAYADIERIKGAYPFEILTPRDNDSYEI